MRNAFFFFNLRLGVLTNVGSPSPFANRHQARAGEKEERTPTLHCAPGNVECANAGKTCY